MFESQAASLLLRLFPLFFGLLNGANVHERVFRKVVPFSFADFVETADGIGQRCEVAGLARQAQEHYQRAQEYLKAGDWAGWGEELQKMEEALSRLVELSARTE